MLCACVCVCVFSVFATVCRETLPGIPRDNLSVFVKLFLRDGM